jgi:hypothetical protein
MRTPHTDKYDGGHDLVEYATGQGGDDVRIRGCSQQEVEF